jgi:integrase
VVTANRRRRRKRNFVRVGAIRIPWRVLSDGRTLIDPRRYGLKRQTFMDRSAALEEAYRIARDRNNEGAGSLEFTSADRAVYAAALQKINGKPYSLLEVVDAGVAALSRPVHGVGTIIAELISSKQPRDLNSRYRDGLISDLQGFASEFPGDIGAVEAKQIEQYLAVQQQTRGLGVRARNHLRDNICHLFNFARQRKYLPLNETSAAQLVPRVEPATTPVEFFAIWEMQLLLAHVREQFLPWLALNAFSGVRLQEISLAREASRRKDPLRWEDFDWSAREIAVRPETSKTGRARRVPILDNLFEWLTPWHTATGKVCDGHPADHEARRVVREANKVLEKANDKRRVAWRKNALRHSYGSYRMAIIQNKHQLAYEMGNSVAMIDAHYHNPRPAADARAYFLIMPEESSKVVRLGRAR